jgi:hypothetical protein
MALRAAQLFIGAFHVFAAMWLPAELGWALGSLQAFAMATAIGACGGFVIAMLERSRRTP